MVEVFRQGLANLREYMFGMVRAIGLVGILRSRLLIVWDLRYIIIVNVDHGLRLH